MTLYEINAAILSCMREVIDEETGEITEEIVDTEALEALQLAKSEKVEGIACWIKDLWADAKAMKAEEERLYQRRKAAEKKAESLRSYLEATCNGQRFKGIRADISFRSVSSVAVDDMSLLPEQYIRTKITTEPDKVALKKVLTHTEIPGAHLETRLSATIR